MTGSSIFSVWTLPLLLLLPPLFVCISLSNHVCKNTHEFSRNVKDFGNNVNDCPENCSSHISVKSCWCLNFTKEEQAFPVYFTKGLEKTKFNFELQRTNSSGSRITKVITHLLKKLHLFKNCKHLMDFSQLTEDYEPVVSPKGLWRKLENLQHQINIISMKR